MLPVVARYTHEVLMGATHLAPRGDHMSGSGRPAKGEPLAPSIRVTSFRMSAASIDSKVGSRVKYAATVHQGSDSHVIRSSKGKMLKFRWARGDFLIAARQGRRGGNKRTGRFHYFLSVRHPGNRRPVQYLVRPLHMYGRLYNFKVISFLPAAGPLP
jgi:hypothetical protein